LRIVFKNSDSEKWRLLRAMDEVKNVLLMISDCKFVTWFTNVDLRKTI